MPVACESVGLEVFCLVEGPNEHSVGHGKELCRSICTNRRLSEAQRSVVSRKRIGPDSLTFVTGVCVPDVEDPPLQSQLQISGRRVQGLRVKAVKGSRFRVLELSHRLATRTSGPV